MFRERWRERMEAGKHLCAGFDPTLEKLPVCLRVKHRLPETDQELRRYAADHFFPYQVSAGVGLSKLQRDQIHLQEALADWLLPVLRAVAPYVAVVKPNYWFYTRLGTWAELVLRDLIVATHQADNLAVLDLKGGDVRDSALCTAATGYDRYGADALTGAPWVGSDGMFPLARHDRGLFVLCHTSNPSAGEVQELVVQSERGEGPLYLSVADLVHEWSVLPEVGLLGLVAGATYPEEIGRIRDVAPQVPLLVPGVGKQQGDLAAAVRAAGRDGAPFVVNASSAILGASAGEDYAAAAGERARRYHEEIMAALAA